MYQSKVCFFKKNSRLSSSLRNMSHNDTCHSYSELYFRVYHKPVSNVTFNIVAQSCDWVDGCLRACVRFLPASLEGAQYGIGYFIIWSNQVALNPRSLLHWWSSGEIWTERRISPLFDYISLKHHPTPAEKHGAQEDGKWRFLIYILHSAEPPMGERWADLTKLINVMAISY